MKKESVFFSEGFDIGQIEELPYEKSSGDYLRFAVAESLINYEFPDNFTGMTLMIERSGLGS